MQSLMKRKRGVAAGYQANFSDGCSWRFNSTPIMRPWLEHLCQIMELRAGPPDVAGKEIFFQEASEAARLKGHKNLFENQWVSLWAPSGGTGRLHIELKMDCGQDMEYLQMWYALAPIYWQSVAMGGIPFHAALIEARGQGLILAGSGNAGKSTTSHRLRHIWKPLCDDEMLVSVDEENDYRVHPFPTWSDYIFRSSSKTWNVEHSVPLRAILFLKKSHRDELVPLDAHDAAVLINQSAVQVCQKFWKGMNAGLKRRFAQSIFDNACQMARRVPAYTLRVSLVGKFWELIERDIFGIHLASRR